MLTAAVKIAMVVLMVYGTGAGLAYMAYALKQFSKHHPVNNYWLLLWALPTLLLLMFVLLGAQLDLMYQNNERAQAIHERMMEHNK